MDKVFQDWVLIAGKQQYPEVYQETLICYGPGKCEKLVIPRYIEKDPSLMTQFLKIKASIGLDGIKQYISNISTEKRPLTNFQNQSSASQDIPAEIFERLHLESDSDTSSDGDIPVSLVQEEKIKDVDISVKDKDVDANIHLSSIEETTHVSSPLDDIPEENLYAIMDAICVEKAETPDLVECKITNVRPVEDTPKVSFTSIDEETIPTDNGFDRIYNISKLLPMIDYPQSNIQQPAEEEVINTIDIKESEQVTVTEDVSTLTNVPIETNVEEVISKDISNVKEISTNVVDQDISTIAETSDIAVVKEETIVAEESTEPIAQDTLNTVEETTTVVEQEDTNDVVNVPIVIKDDETEDESPSKEFNFNDHLDKMIENGEFDSTSENSEDTSDEIQSSDAFSFFLVKAEKSLVDSNNRFDLNVNTAPLLVRDKVECPKIYDCIAVPLLFIFSAFIKDAIKHLWIPNFKAVKADLKDPKHLLFASTLDSLVMEKERVCDQVCSTFMDGFGQVSRDQVVKAFSHVLFHILGFGVNISSVSTSGSIDIAKKSPLWKLETLESKHINLGVNFYELLKHQDSSTLESIDLFVMFYVDELQDSPYPLEVKATIPEFIRKQDGISQGTLRLVQGEYKHVASIIELSRGGSEKTYVPFLLDQTSWIRPLIPAKPDNAWHVAASDHTELERHLDGVVSRKGILHLYIYQSKSL
jgi:hypothetical protein